MSLLVQISGKFFPEISTIGETPEFVDFTPQEISSDGYLKIGSKSFSIPATIVDGQPLTNDGKSALMAEIEAVATAYLNTVLTDAEAAYDAKIYVLSVDRKNVVDEGVTEESKYTAKVDYFGVEVRFESSTAAAAAIGVQFSTTTVVKLDATNFEITVTIENDDADQIETVDVTITPNGGGSTANPDTFTLSSPTIGVDKVFVSSVVLFDDPSTVVGELYDVFADAKNSDLGTVISESQPVTVDPIV